MKFLRTSVLGAVALSASLASGAVLAQERITVNIGSSHPVQNIWAWAMKNVFQPEVDRILEENGGNYTIRWRENYGGTLYGFSDTRVAVRDRIVDVGMVGTVWESSSMPLQNVTYFTPFATTDHELVIDIFDKLSTELPELRDSWAEQNMVHLSSLITDPYDIYATRSFDSLDDLQNVRLHAPGTSANWLRGTGATPVDGALTVYYTNIQTGVTDGALSFASGIGPARVYEVAQHLTRVGLGAMYFGSVAVNKQFFDGLPEEVQEAFRAAGRETSLRHGEHVTRLAEQALEEMEEAGLQISELPDEEKRRWVESMPNIVGPWLEAHGEPAATVLRAYFDELRAHGEEPLRDWDAQVR
jgi:TRAP-type C4-dicarboxylate transport system substrate-binding protein